MANRRGQKMKHRLLIALLVILVIVVGVLALVSAVLNIPYNLIQYAKFAQNYQEHHLATPFDWKHGGCDILTSVKDALPDVGEKWATFKDQGLETSGATAVIMTTPARYDLTYTDGAYKVWSPEHPESQSTAIAELETAIDIFRVCGGVTSWITVMYDGTTWYQRVPDQKPLENVQITVDFSKLSPIARACGDYAYVVVDGIVVWNGNASQNDTFIARIPQKPDGEHTLWEVVVMHMHSTPDGNILYDKIAGVGKQPVFANKENTIQVENTMDDYLPVCFR